MRHFLIPLDDLSQYKRVEYVYLDGYSVGERQLEGLYFKVEIDKNGEFVVSVPQEFEFIFKKLNEKYWLDEAKQYCSRRDIFIVDIDKEEIEAVCWNDTLTNDQQSFYCPTTPNIVD